MDPWVRRAIVAYYGDGDEDVSTSASYLTTIGKRRYAVVSGQNRQPLAVYRVEGDRRLVRVHQRWPAEITSNTFNATEGE